MKNALLDIQNKVKSKTSYWPGQLQLALCSLHCTSSIHQHEDIMWKNYNIHKPLVMGSNKASLQVLKNEMIKGKQIQSL